MWCTWITPKPPAHLLWKNYLPWNRSLVSESWRTAALKKSVPSSYAEQGDVYCPELPAHLGNLAPHPEILPGSIDLDWEFSWDFQVRTSHWLCALNKLQILCRRQKEPQTLHPALRVIARECSKQDWGDWRINSVPTLISHFTLSPLQCFPSVYRINVSGFIWRK